MYETLLNIFIQNNNLMLIKANVPETTLGGNVSNHSLPTIVFDHQTVLARVPILKSLSFVMKMCNANKVLNP